MPEPRWTPAQQAAIDDRGGALLVSAAAGSGKTAVLTERAVSLICDPQHPINADRLLILTFTNAAAAELRARIAARLSERLRRSPGDHRLRRQLLLLQRANICTIDAFCLHLLREHFGALDIPPDFVKGDEAELAALKQRALETALEAACQDEDFCRFADQYGKGRSDAAAGQAVLALYDFLQSLPEPEAALQQFVAAWQQQRPFSDTPWAAVLLRRVGEALREGAACAARALRLAMEAAPEEQQLACEGKKTPAAVRKAEEAARQRAQGMVAYCQQWQAYFARFAQQEPLGWDALYTFVHGSALPEPPKRTVYKAREQYAAIRGLLKELKALVEALRQNVLLCTQAQAEQDRAAAAPLVAALARAESLFAEAFYQEKLEHKRFDFSDFEHLAKKLLWRNGARTELCESISQGFAAVLVDEYQDTNQLQDCLYRCLANAEGTNLFLVGDLKQSIYRFRQAEPGVFGQKLASYGPLPRAEARPWAAAAQPPAQLALDVNFRSAPGVVEAINYFFGQLMSQRLGDVDYVEGQRLCCGAAGDFPGDCTVLVSREQESAAVARYIAECLEQGVPVRDSAAPGGVRPCAQGDFCVLMSTRGAFTEYEKALEAKGLAVYADTAEDILAAPQNRWLAALLRVLDNPAQDVPLAAALLSPLFGCTEDDLVRLRAQGGKGSLYAALLAVCSAEQPGDFSRRMGEIQRALLSLRGVSHTMPVERLLEEILVSTGYLAAVGAMPDGANRRRETQAFVRWCGQSASLPELCRRMDAAEQGGGVPDVQPGAQHPGCVNLMTIHRSKGLQFPFVILAETGHRFNNEESRAPLLFHRELGIGLRLRGVGGLYSTGARQAIQHTVDQESQSEKMRLLYVALTRAQDHLVLSTALEQPEKKLAGLSDKILAGMRGSLLQGASSFATWVLYAALLHPDGRPLRELAGAPDLPVAIGEQSRLQVLLPQPLQQELEAEAPRTGEPAGQANPAWVAAVEQRFAWQYPAQKLQEIPVKITVSEIVHAQDTQLERPGFLSRTNMTAAEMGTAIHAFLQYADFAALARGLETGDLNRALQQEADRQWAASLLEAEKREQLDFEKLAAFVQCGAFRRILAAQRLWREFDFITALPATVVDKMAPPEAKVLVQGIADLVLEYPDHLEILDYKTDRNKTPEEFRAAYTKQLRLYAAALEKRFAPKPVTSLAIIALQTGTEIPVSLAENAAGTRLPLSE